MRQQPPVCHQRNLVQAEAIPELVKLPGQRRGIRHGAFEDLYAHGPSVLVAQQSEVDLLLALLAVAVVAELGKIRAVAFNVSGGHVAENDRAFRKVALCEPPLYAVLARIEPVHGFVDLVLMHIGESEFMAQAAGLAFLLEGLGGGELAAGAQDARHDEGKHDVARSAVLGIDQPVELQLAERAQGGGDMSVGEPAHKGEVFLEGVHEVVHDHASSKHFADQVAGILGQFGDVGEGGLAGFSVDPCGLADEVGGVGVPVGDALDVHGQYGLVTHSYEDTKLGANMRR